MTLIGTTAEALGNPSIIMRRLFSLPPNREGGDDLVEGSSSTEEEYHTYSLIKLAIVTNPPLLPLPDALWPRKSKRRLQIQKTKKDDFHLR